MRVFEDNSGRSARQNVWLKVLYHDLTRPARTQFLIEPEDLEHVWSNNRRRTKRAKLNRKVTWTDTIIAVAVRMGRQNNYRNQERCSQK